MQGSLAPKTPADKSASQIFHIQFSGFIFQIIVFSEQQISISFNQITSCTIFQKTAHLVNITYKTVVAGLKKQHSNIVQAQLSKSQNSYILIFKVQYEYLPPFQQIIKFDERKITQKQMSQLELKNYSYQIKDIKKQIAIVSNCKVKTFVIDTKNKQFPYQIPKQTVLLTWSMHIKTTSNIIKLAIYYFDSVKNVQKKSKLIPGDSVSVFASNGSASLQMRFLIEPIQQFDQLIFKIDNKIEGKFHIIEQKI